MGDCLQYNGFTEKGCETGPEMLFEAVNGLNRLGVLARTIAGHSKASLEWGAEIEWGLIEA